MLATKTESGMISGVELINLINNKITVINDISAKYYYEDDVLYLNIFYKDNFLLTIKYTKIYE